MTIAPVEISPEEHKTLKRLEAQKQALDQFMRQMLEEGEAKLEKYNRNVANTWRQIAEKHGVDVENVMWVPHPTEPKIIPVQMRFNNSLPSAS